MTSILRGGNKKSRASQVKVPDVVKDLGDITWVGGYKDCNSRNFGD